MDNRITIKPNGTLNNNNKPYSEEKKTNNSSIKNNLEQTLGLTDKNDDPHWVALVNKKIESSNNLIFANQKKSFIEAIEIALSYIHTHPTQVEETIKNIIDTYLIPNYYNGNMPADVFLEYEPYTYIYPEKTYVPNGHYTDSQNPELLEQLSKIRKLQEQYLSETLDKNDANWKATDLIFYREQLEKSIPDFCNTYLSELKIEGIKSLFSFLPRNKSFLGMVRFLEFCNTITPPVYKNEEPSWVLEHLSFFQKAFQIYPLITNTTITPQEDKDTLKKTASLALLNYYKSCRFLMNSFLPKCNIDLGAFIEALSILLKSSTFLKPKQLENIQKSILPKEGLKEWTCSELEFLAGICENGFGASFQAKPNVAQKIRSFLKQYTDSNINK